MLAEKKRIGNDESVLLSDMPHSTVAVTLDRDWLEIESS